MIEAPYTVTMSTLHSALSAACRPSCRSERGGATLAVIGVLAMACAATSAVIWIMHLTANSTGVPEFSKAVTVTEPTQMSGSRDALAQMFGAPVFASTKGAREIEGVQLQGIVSDKRGTGVALFSVDGASPVRVRAGALVRDGVKLLEIRQQQVLLERGGNTFELALVKRTGLQDALTDARQRNIQTGQTVNPGAGGNVVPGDLTPSAVAPPAR